MSMSSSSARGFGFVRPTKNLVRCVKRVGLRAPATLRSGGVLGRDGSSAALVSDGPFNACVTRQPSSLGCREGFVCSFACSRVDSGFCRCSGFRFCCFTGQTTLLCNGLVQSSAPSAAGCGRVRSSSGTSSIVTGLLRTVRKLGIVGRGRLGTVSEGAPRGRQCSLQYWESKVISIPAHETSGSWH